MMGTLGKGSKNSKWKFKMVFAMKGGGGFPVSHTYSEKLFIEKHLESFPDC